MGPLDDQVLRDDAVTVTPDGLDIAVHTHWYRALPLSCVVRLDVTVDGTPVVPDVTVNGVRRTRAELADLTGEYWFTTDPLILHVPGTAGEHRVELDLGLSIPYILTGPDRRPLLSASRADRTLTARRP
ncbi:DUF6379 domain-containing protein [Actinoallomurus spadix]|uniref:C-deglycosylation enzyme beta subunit n=1 Tax=Actinoallomurus spadix TaxID=79912 RepID=A0ABN0XJG1_9ACTN|nr:DUF6379 domain-containing protein [Actinoallomurus spadix]MCO5984926.1 DUF6379 domain-containing protein [Actinoallomurus spadix]